MAKTRNRQQRVRLSDAGCTGRERWSAGRRISWRLAGIARVNYQPPMVAMSLSKSHYTNGGYPRAQGVQREPPSLNLLGRTDYCD